MNIILTASKRKCLVLRIAMYCVRSLITSALQLQYPVNLLFCYFVRALLFFYPRGRQAQHGILRLRGVNEFCWFGESLIAKPGTSLETATLCMRLYGFQSVGLTSSRMEFRVGRTNASKGWEMYLCTDIDSLILGGSFYVSLEWNLGGCGRHCSQIQC